MVHLKVDIAGADPDVLALLLETIMEEIAQGSRSGEGYEVIGESEPDDELELDEGLLEDDEDDLSTIDQDFDLDDPLPTLLSQRASTTDLSEHLPSASGERMNDVVCLSGSMRFFADMLRLASMLTKQGKIVLPPFVTKNGDAELATMLDELHQRKIAMSETLYVVAVDGYLGESTRREIAFARSRGIPVVFWPPDEGESSAR